MAEKKLTFQLNDGTEVNIPEKYRYMFKTIDDMLGDVEDGMTMDKIPIVSDHINSKVMGEILTYCNYYGTGGLGFDEENKFYDKEYDMNITMAPDSPWDKEYFSKYSIKELEQIMNGTNFLNMPGFIERGSKYIGETYILGKTAEEIRTVMNLPDNLTY